jgi:hypothetical protein
VKARHPCFTRRMPEIVPIPEGTPSWPVDNPECGADGVSERELWFSATVFDREIALELRSSHPLTTSAYRAAARDLLRIADEFEAELPEFD